MVSPTCKAWPPYWSMSWETSGRTSPVGCTRRAIDHKVSPGCTMVSERVISWACCRPSGDGEGTAARRAGKLAQAGPGEEGEGHDEEHRHETPAPDDRGGGSTSGVRHRRHSHCGPVFSIRPGVDRLHLESPFQELVGLTGLLYRRGVTPEPLFEQIPNTRSLSSKDSNGCLQSPRGVVTVRQNTRSP